MGIRTELSPLSVMDDVHSSSVTEEIKIKVGFLHYFVVNLFFFQKIVGASFAKPNGEVNGGRSMPPSSLRENRSEQDAVGGFGVCEVLVGRWEAGVFDFSLN